MYKIPIYVINLKKDIHKKEHIQSLCKKYDLECTFIDAVYGRDLDDEYIEQIYSKDNAIKEIKRELTKGEIGCALSHLSICKSMIKDNISSALILEDDAEFDEKLREVIQLIDSFPKYWDLILLGYYTDTASENKTPASYWYKKRISDYYSLVRLIEATHGAHGYLLSQSGAKKLLNQAKILKKPIDLYTGEDKVLNLYALSSRVIGLNSDLKQQSNLEIERKEMNNSFGLSSKSVIQKQDSFLYKILKSIGIFNILKIMKNESILFFRKIKPIRKYK